MVLPRKWFIDRFPKQTKTCFLANVSLAKGLTPRLSSSVPRRAGTLRVPQRCSWPWRMDTEKFRASCGRAWFEWRCEQNMEWIYHHLEKTSFYWDNYIKLGIFSKPLWIGDDNPHYWKRNHVLTTAHVTNLKAKLSQLFDDLSNASNSLCLIVKTGPTLGGWTGPQTGLYNLLSGNLPWPKCA